MEAWRKDLVTKNTKLVYFCYNRYIQKTPFTIQHKEEFLNEGMFGLCKAAKAYNPELGNSFSTYAVLAILNQMRMYLRKDKGRYDKTVSLETEVQDTVGITLADMLISNCNPDDNILLQQVLDYINKTLKPKDIQIFRLYLEDKPQRQIAKMFGTSQKTVSLSIKKTKQKVIEYFNK